MYPHKKVNFSENVQTIDLTSIGAFIN